MKDLDNVKIIMRGAGDLATGVALRLHRAGFRHLLLLETEHPLAVRRLVSFVQIGVAEPCSSSGGLVRECNILGFALACVWIGGRTWPLLHRADSSTGRIVGAARVAQAI